MKPLYTIVTVVYNDVEKIERTLESVLSQEGAAFEYIVIDGGSTDGTLDILDRYAGRLAHCISEPDKGIYDAMNKGIALAQGTWINFMNSGDTFVDTQVLARLEPVAADSCCDIIYGDIRVKNNSDTYELRKASPCARNIHRMFFCHQSAFVRTEILRHNNFDIRHKLSADFKFFKECYTSGFRFHYADEALAVFDTKGVSNIQRVRSLKDNARVVAEVDRGGLRLKHLIKLWYVIIYLSAVNLFRNTPSEKR